MTLESPKQLTFEDMCKYWHSDSSFLHQLSLDELLKHHKKFNFTPKSPLPFEPTVETIHFCHIDEVSI
jgi:hypothetical protein